MASKALPQIGRFKSISSFFAGKPERKESSEKQISSLVNLPRDTLRIIFEYIPCDNSNWANVMRTCKKFGKTIFIDYDYLMR